MEGREVLTVLYVDDFTNALGDWGIAGWLSWMGSGLFERDTFLAAFTFSHGTVHSSPFLYVQMAETSLFEVSRALEGEICSLSQRVDLELPGYTTIYM